MNTIIGANWRTTLSGWIAVVASAIALNPSLVAFLPEALRGYVAGVAGLIAVASGGAFAAQAKDRQVTGGTEPNDNADCGASGSANPSGKIAPLILAALIPAFALGGCAWIAAHQAQIDATLAVIGPRVVAVAEQSLLNVAVGKAQKASAANYLDGIASGLRANAPTIVTSEDVEKIIAAWAPPSAADSCPWQSLIGQVATVAGDAFEARGETDAAAVVEQIAVGLNNAAEQARSAASANGTSGTNNTVSGK